MQPQGPVPKNPLGEGTYKAKNIIIATGARPRVLPGIEPDGDKIWTYFEAMKPAAMPKSLVVMGSGAIGVEFASFYRSMGAEVTIIELLPQILPVEDAEISALVRKRLEKRGIKILTDAKVAKVEKTKDGVIAHVELKSGEKQEIAGDKLISAVGVHVQYRRAGAGDGRRQDRARRHCHRWLWPHQCGGHLGHWRRRRPADAGAQGRA